MGRGWIDSAAYRAAVGVITIERTSLEVSQRELARRLGKPPSFVNKIELLERRLDIVELIAVARALGVKPEALFGKILEAIPSDDH
ncbi:helix-turn-helix transcriptional regulator [Sphingomonas sp. LY54]|uniref:helix-turn-helix domain-containing protein n=1 Tax=Sphingomonas sp. LY54 TaxID=3095343 RepID=UPI002D78C744|nr:helix-turn-helix transcriptional regulator [Sphingomonas sp. LY54]WRP28739.1 helix-turn-helix transcriptional regulator [Sphingomonas sp. LY54]